MEGGKDLNHALKSESSQEILRILDKKETKIKKVSRRSLKSDLKVI